PAHRLQLVPQSPLPPMPGGRPGPMARRAGLRTPARSVLPRGVYATLPEEIGPLAMQNPRLVYSTLFRAAESMLQIAADPKHLGAQIGFLAVLHPWGQNLHLHPHVHGVVSGGGLSADSTRWLACRQGFFLPVRVLSRLFRGKFLALLQNAYERQQRA